MRALLPPLLILFVGGILVLGLFWLEQGRAQQAGAPLAKGKEHPQGGVHTGCYSEPDHLNPLTTSDAVARRAILRFTHDTLLEWDPWMVGLRPGMATSHTFDPETRWLNLTIRANARFSDGSTVKLEDLRFAFDVHTKTEVALGKVGEALALIEKLEVGGLRMRMRLRHSYAGVVAKVATGYPVLQRRFFEEACRGRAKVHGTDTWTLLQEELPNVRRPGPGTGPYRLAQDLEGGVWWRPGEEIRLVQNPSSWHHQIRKASWNLAGFRLLFVQEPAARLAMLQRGEIDWLANTDVHGLLAREPELAQTYRTLTYDQLGSGHFVLLWNHRHAQLAKPNVRQALTLLFDRETISKKLMNGQGRVPVGWCSPGSNLAAPDVKPLPFDPERARQVLQEAWPIGEGEPRRLRILIAAGNPLQRRIMEATAPAMERAGLKADVVALPWSAMLPRLNEHDFDGILLHMSLDPTGDPYFTFHSSQSRGHNFMGYRSQKADRLLEAARAEQDPQRRVALLHDFHRLFHRDQPVTLLAYAMSGILLHKRFQDAEPNRLGLFPERWWVKPEDRR